MSAAFGQSAAPQTPAQEQTTRTTLSVRAPSMTTSGSARSSGDIGEQNLYEHIGDEQQSCANRPPLDRCEDLQVAPNVARR